MKKEYIYFASDFHLGSPNWKESSIREKIIVEWLDKIKKDAKEIYLLGDIFDFWYEYKKVVPKGFIRFLGKLAELSDNNIEIHIIVGNHDLWMRDYLKKEIGISIHQNSIIINRYHKSIFLAHGDNVGKQKISYKFIKSIFLNKTCQWLFSRIHPNTAISFAQTWSRKSRLLGKNDPYLGSEKEIIELFCKKHKQRNREIDFYILGHRHLPLNIEIEKNCRYINTGDWINHLSYATLKPDGSVQLEYYKKK